DEQHTLQQELARHVSRFDVVITTAQVPGRRPPLLVVAEALEEMDPGSVVVDVACSDLGGNVEGSVPDTTTVTPGGVTVIGAGNLPAQMAPAASAAYARNLTALLAYRFPDRVPRLAPSDEIRAGVLVTHDGAVVNRAVAGLLAGEGASWAPTWSSS